MLSIFRVNGQMMAAMECQVVNEQGTLDPLGGLYVFVEQIELNHFIDHKQAFSYFIEYFANLVPQAKWAYWIRRDRDGGKKIRLYSRHRLMNMVEKYASNNFQTV